MKQKDKKLLLKDICARLPYGVKVAFNSRNGVIPASIVAVDYLDWEMFSIKPEGEITYLCSIEKTKPYLRSLSSMTEEEKIELRALCDLSYPCIDYDRYGHLGIEILKEKFDKYLSCDSSINVEVIDWLNSHHFDYRGLIEKGLALEAPEGMYK